MNDPRSASSPRGGSTLLVPLNLLIALVLMALAALGVAFPCAGDVCFGGVVVSVTLAPTLAVVVGLGIRYLWGRSALLAIVDAAIAALIVGVSSRTILQLDVSGMLTISLFLAAPLAAGLLAAQEAAHGLERTILVAALAVLAGVFVLQPEVRLGALVPLLVSLALAFPRPRPLPYGTEAPEARATLRDHGEDREE
jgi:hypothetical protein